MIHSGGTGSRSCKRPTLGHLRSLLRSNMSIEDACFLRVHVGRDVGQHGSTAAVTE